MIDFQVQREHIPDAKVKHHLACKGILTRSCDPVEENRQAMFVATRRIVAMPARATLGCSARGPTSSCQNVWLRVAVAIVGPMRTVARRVVFGVHCVVINVILIRIY